MTLKYYPVCLDISNRKCVVIGGGEVAERKVLSLLECGASVALAAISLTDLLSGLVQEKRIEHLGGPYEDCYLEGAFMVIGATDRPEINRRIFEDARKRGVLVNIVDEPSRCDFIVPAVFNRGDLSVAVSTGGRSPALARRIREELEERYGPEYGTLLRIMGKIRRKILEKGAGPEANRRIFEDLLDAPLLACIREERWDEVRELIRERVGEDIPLD